MDILTFTDAGDASGRITRTHPRRDPGAEDRLMWDVDVTFEVDEGAAHDLLPAIPNAEDLFARARDKRGSSVVTWRPADRDVDLVIANDAGKLILESPAEVRHVKLRCQEKKQVCIAKLRVFALDEKTGGALAMCLDKVASLSVNPRQQSMDFGDGPTKGDVICARAGDAEVYGIYRGRKKGKLVIDDFGATHLAETMVSRLRVDDPDALLDKYAEAVRGDGAEPTWRDLIGALTSAFADGDADVQPETGRWVLTPAVTAAAAADALPPEPEAKPKTTKRRKKKGSRG